MGGSRRPGRGRGRGLGSLEFESSAGHPAGSLRRREGMGSEAPPRRGDREAQRALDRPRGGVWTGDGGGGRIRTCERLWALRGAPRREARRRAGFVHQQEYKSCSFGHLDTPPLTSTVASRARTATHPGSLRGGVMVCRRRTDRSTDAAMSKRSSDGGDLRHEAPSGGGRRGLGSIGSFRSYDLDEPLGQSPADHEPWVVGRAGSLWAVPSMLKE